MYVCMYVSYEKVYEFIFSVNEKQLTSFGDSTSGLKGHHLQNFLVTLSWIDIGDGIEYVTQLKHPSSTLL